MALRPIHAFLLSFAVGFIVGFAFIGVSLGWLGIFFPGLVAQLTLLVALVVGAFTGFVGLGMFYIWRALGRTGQLAVIGLLLVVGILTVQPELDGLAVIAAMFTFLGVGKGRGR